MDQINLFIKKLNAQGAKYALLTGAVLGSLRLVLELNKSNLQGFWFWYADINFLHFALALFLFCSGVLISVSLVSRPSNLSAEIQSIKLRGLRELAVVDRFNLILSILLVGLIFVLWIYFS